MSEWFYTATWFYVWAMVGWSIGWLFTIFLKPHTRTRFNLWFNFICLGLMTIVYLVVVWEQGT